MDNGMPPPGQTAGPPGGSAGFARQTRQRRAVLGCLAGNPGFVTAQDLRARLRAGGEHVGLATVYRTLHALAAAGLADTARDPAAGQLFRFRSGQHGHQHYLICRRCRRSVTVTSVAVEHWASALGRDHGFTDIQHVIEFTGLCGTCQSHPARRV